jgi:hypothetical protein
MMASAICTAVGCTDAGAPQITGTEPEQDAQFAMALEAVAEANRLYALAAAADSAGQYNRATLLWAAIDGLQFGAPMHDVTITVDGVPIVFRTILEDAVLTEKASLHSSARLLLAWSGENADRILVLYDQALDAGPDMMLYTDGGDALFLGFDATLAVTRSALGSSCVLDQQTPLTGPTAECLSATMSASASGTALLDGIAGAASRAISFSTGEVFGIQLTRALEDFGT